MQNGREKKPPVNINDVRKEQKEEPKQGTISYLGNGGSSSSSSGSKGKVNLTQLLLSVGMAVLIVIVVGHFTFASKGDASVLLDNQRLLESNQAETEAQLETETGRIDNVVNNYATKNELSSVESQIQGFATQSALDSLKEVVLGQGNDIEALEDRVDNLEASINSTTPITGGGSYCYLTQQTDGFGLTAMSSRTGFYLAQVTLILDDPHEFTGLVGTGRDFIQNKDSEGKTVSITFYTGEFKLNAGEVEDDLEIPLDLSAETLTVGYEAYVELLPSAVTSTGGGSII